VQRTHAAIERALAGVIAPLGTLAVLVSETITNSVAVVMLRATLAEHLERQQRRARAAREQTALGAIREAVLATPADRAPVVIATREGRAILQAVAGEPPPASAVPGRSRPVTASVQVAVLAALVDGPKLGCSLRDELATRFERAEVGRALEGLQHRGSIHAIERRGRRTTWALTLPGEGEARAAIDRQVAA
jgi:hypothetical protein